MSSANFNSGNYDVEYRAIPDDAWYSVCALFDGEKLTIKYDNFSDDDDSVFRPQDFKSLKEVEDFEGRFRPISVQLQDNECKSIGEGMMVCASCCFTELDVRFFDAFVDDVIYRDHTFANGEEQCTCNFVVMWKHGPIAGCLASRKIENICRPRSTSSIDPNVGSFLELVRKKLQTANELTTSSPRQPQPFFSPQFYNGTNCARLVLKSQEIERMLNYTERVKEETDLGGDSNQYFVIDNLEKDLSPSAIVDFIYSQTSVSVKAYVFPSLPLQTYTKGMISLKSPNDLQKLCELLDSPDCIIVSWRGRPWVVTKKVSLHIAYVMPFGTMMSKHQEGKSNEIGRIKVVYSGSEEYKVAEQWREMFIEFVEHQERLHTTLALEENKILQRTSVR